LKFNHQQARVQQTRKSDTLTQQSFVEHGTFRASTHTTLLKAIILDEQLANQERCR
jgi:hypothetical protein